MAQEARSSREVLLRFLEAIDMAQIRSESRFVRVSSSKLKPAADLIRGRSIRLAQQSLEFLPNRSAMLLRKCLASLVANAEDRGVRNAENLLLSRVEIGTGPIMRRIRPMSRGQAFVIRKRLSHILMAVDVPEL
jgi:large subunit ribosomal protein L22